MRRCSAPCRPSLSCKKLVQMDLKLKSEFEKTRVTRRPYPAPQEQVEEIERQIQECIDAGLVEEYKKGDYPHYCSPCFLVAKPGSTALRLVVDFGLRGSSCMVKMRQKLPLRGSFSGT